MPTARMDSHELEDAVHPRGRALMRTVELIVGLLVLVPITAVALRPEKAWHVTWQGVPHPTLLALLVTYVVIAVLVRSDAWKGLRALVLAAILGAMYVTSRVPPFGDHYLLVSMAHHDEVWASGLLAYVANHVVAHAWGREALYCMAPVFGFLAGLFVLLLGERCLPKASAATGRVLWALSYIGSGVHLCYFRGFVENTQLAIPLVVGTVWFSLNYLRATARRGELSSLAATTLTVTLATLVHGQNLFLLPALPVLVLYKRGFGRPLGRTLAEMACSLLGAAVVATGVVLSVSSSHLTVRPGTVDGGPQGLFVPLFLKDPERYVRYGMFWPEHLLEVGNIFLACAALSGVVGLCLAVGAARGRVAGNLATRTAVLFAGGYVAFCWLFNFDFGAPQDYDLMVGMGWLLWMASTIVMVAWATRGPWRPFVAGALLLVILFGTWMLMTRFLDPAWSPRGQRNTPAAGLVIQGEGTGRDRGPLEVVLDRATPQFDIEVWGPPGGRFSLMSGPKNTACAGSVLGGTFDIGTPRAFRDLSIVLSGDLDARGRFKETMRAADFPPGTRLHVQAVIFPQGESLERRGQAWGEYCQLTVAFDLEFR